MPNRFLQVGGAGWWCGQTVFQGSDTHECGALLPSRFEEKWTETYLSGEENDSSYSHCKSSIFHERIDHIMRCSSTGNLNGF